MCLQKKRRQKDYGDLIHPDPVYFGFDKESNCSNSENKTKNVTTEPVAQKTVNVRRQKNVVTNCRMFQL